MARRPLKRADAAPSDEEQIKQRFARLQALGEALAGTRKEAIDGRKASGIEDIWREDEEAFEGFDEKNRGNATSMSKPPGQLVPQVAGSESIEFPNITGPYVEAAAAKVGDILLPTDDRAWSLTNTPIPELMERAKSGGLPIDVIAGMGEAGIDEATAVKVAQAEQADAQAVIEQAKDKAKRAEKRIEDWHIEGQYHGEMRKVLDAATRIGTGVLKGPIPIKKRQQMYRDDALVIEWVTKPVSKEVDAWNCFPDPACGQSIHNGRYHWECDHLTDKQLLALKDDPDYIAEQIDACIDEGPTKKGETRQTADGRYIDDKKLFQVWYFYGFATREDMEAAGCECPKDGPVMIPAVFTMVNDRVIKGALNHLDTGEFPYDYLPWQRRKNLPWGKGVARQIRTAQRIVTAATRVMLTNGGRAAGPMIVMRKGVRGSNGRNDVEPWKTYTIPDDADVRAAFAMIEIPDRQASLMAIIQYGFELAEKITGLPLMTVMGQQGDAPDTYGGQQLFDRNAAGVLRRIARTVDDCITEPHIRRYYTYLLLYGPEDVEKGEFQLDARGSTALVERELTRQQAEAKLQASLNPAFGLSPKKTMEQLLRAENRNPKDYQYDEEEQKRIDEAQQNPQPDPRAQASMQSAKIRSDADLQKATITATSDMKELAFKAAEAEKQRRFEESMAARQERIEMMKLASAQNTSVSEIKAQLAGKAMTISAQERMAARKNAAAPQVATPAVEPPGRAPAGEAFQK